MMKGRCLDILFEGEVTQLSLANGNDLSGRSFVELMAEVRSFMLIKLRPGAGDLLFVNIKVYCGLVTFSLFCNYEMLVYSFGAIMV